MAIPNAIGANLLIDKPKLQVTHADKKIPQWKEFNQITDSFVEKYKILSEIIHREFEVNLLLAEAIKDYHEKNEINVEHFQGYSENEVPSEIKNLSSHLADISSNSKMIKENLRNNMKLCGALKSNEEILHTYFNGIEKYLEIKPDEDSLEQMQEHFKFIKELKEVVLSYSYYIDNLEALKDSESEIIKEIVVKSKICTRFKNQVSLLEAIVIGWEDVIKDAEMERIVMEKLTSESKYETAQLATAQVEVIDNPPYFPKTEKRKTENCIKTDERN